MRIIACFASTLDGKIGSRAHPKDRVGSQADLSHLLRTRNQADALLYGGETFRQHSLLRRGDAQSIAPIQCLLTKTVDLLPEATLFIQGAEQSPPTPTIIVTPEPVSLVLRQRYPAHVEWIVAKNAENPLPEAVSVLEKLGVQTLMIEGGGLIFQLALQARLVHELYLTLCPLLLSGDENPCLVSGPAFRVEQAPRTTMLSSEWRDGELYLHLSLQYPNI
jgi:5-amino-6-(5-phosphoribosylamino)uracil reductase